MADREGLDRQFRMLAPLLLVTVLCLGAWWLGSGGDADQAEDPGTPPSSATTSP